MCVVEKFFLSGVFLDVRLIIPTVQYLLLAFAMPARRLARLYSDCNVKCYFGCSNSDAYSGVTYGRVFHDVADLDFSFDYWNLEYIIFDGGWITG